MNINAKEIKYTYRYCTEEMIEIAMFENETSYPDVMGLFDYAVFEVKANSLEEANNSFLKYQSKYTQKNERMHELEEDVEMDVKVKNDEDRYIRHELEQDWDTYYFKRNKNGLA